MGRLLQSYFEIQQPQQIFESKSHEWIIYTPTSSEILSCSLGVEGISRQQCTRTLMVHLNFQHVELEVPMVHGEEVFKRKLEWAPGTGEVV